MTSSQDKADAQTLLDKVRDKIAGPTAEALERIIDSEHSPADLEDLIDEVDNLENMLHEAKTRLRKMEATCAGEKDMIALKRLRAEFATILEPIPA